MDAAYDKTERVQSRSLLHTLRSNAGFGVLMLLFLALLSLFAVYMLAPPRAVAPTAPATEFSSGRAMKHLEVISRRPHPVGSAEHEEVRNYLLRELGAAGLRPEVQEASVVSDKRGGLRAATVRNVVARLAGTGGGGKALLVAAHYDTVPTAPGASDDGAAVAMMLETVRALKAGQPLRNDVIFLFTDGEELGLLGAQAFVDEHPWAKDVGLVLNFEARGAGGPALMFETSNGNAGLIAEFAKAAPHPAANSLSYEIYKRLPNDTDLTVFKGAGLPGMNFAYIDGFMRYHTRADSVENIDERSLQHQGSYALSLARHFGALQLDRPAAGNAVYFDLLGVTLLHYPASWAVPLAALAFAAFAAVAVLGFRRKRLTLKGLAAGFFLFALSAVVAAAAVTLIWWANAAVQRAAGRSLADDLYRGKLYLAAFALVAVAVTAALYNLYRRRVDTENLTAGALLFLLLLLVATSVLMPGGSYLLLWPLLFGLAALAFVIVSAEEGGSAARFAVLALCAAPAVLLLVPMIYQVFVAMGLGAVGAVAVLVVLLCGLLVPHFAVMGASARWRLPAGAALAAAVLVGLAAFNTGFDKQRPKSDHLFYVMNADSGQAVWASADAAPDEWTSQFFKAGAKRGPLTEYLPFDSYGYASAPAPAAPGLKPADVRVLSDSTQGDVRTLVVRVTSPQEAVNVAVLRDPDVEVVGASVNGRRVQGARAGAAGQGPAWQLQYWAPPKEGFDLALELKGARPVKLRTLGQSYALPELPGVTYSPRPEHIIPSPVPSGDQSLVGKSHAF